MRGTGSVPSHRPIGYADGLLIFPGFGDRQNGHIERVAADILCGHCGAVLSNPTTPCPRCGAPASGRYQSTVTPGRKNPYAAAALAIVPGCGHFYLGHNLKGIGYLLGIGGLQLFGFDLDLTVIGAAVGVPMELGGATLWLYSIVDAYRTAKRMEVEAATARYPA